MFPGCCAWVMRAKSSPLPRGACSDHRICSGPRSCLPSCKLCTKAWNFIFGGCLWLAMLQLCVAWFYGLEEKLVSNK